MNPKSLLARILPAQWSVECWSRPYLLGRLRTWLYQRRNPDAPWFTADAIRLLESRVGPADTVLEFGSGRSTLWFARRCARVESVEHNPAWRTEVNRRLASAVLAGKAVVHAAGEAEYAEVADRFVDDSFTVVVVDNLRRADCVNHALPKLRAGGWLVIDNVNRHLPTECPGPGSLRAFDPADAEHRKWMDLAERLQAWERHMTSNQVWETLVLRKPGGAA